MRIGVNWGSLDQDLLTRADGRERAIRARPIDARAVMREAIVQSALMSAARARGDRPAGATASSCRPRSRAVQDLIAVYRMLAARSRSTRCISG